MLQLVPGEASPWPLAVAVEVRPSVSLPPRRRKESELGDDLGLVMNSCVRYCMWFSFGLWACVCEGVVLRGDLKT